jgi:hypothetical protein
MRSAVERLSILFLSFAIVSVAAFAVLARLTDRVAGRPSDVALFVNPSPHSARELSLSAKERVARGGPDAARAAGELARLGGAALPYVLPELDALSPAARGRVAVALAPVARRMDLADDAPLERPDAAISFWTRFWQDRGADFRAPVVRRKVKRFSEHSLALREKEVQELDGYAVTELVAALGPVRTTKDVERVRRVASMLCHITGQSWQVPAGASVADASAIAARFREWSLSSGADYATLDGPGRLGAMVTQTRYFRWLAKLGGALRYGDTVARGEAETVLLAAKTTLALGLVPLVLGTLLGALLTRARSHTAGLGRGVRAAAFAIAAVPLALLAIHAAFSGPVLLSALLVGGLTASVVVRLAGETRGASARDIAWCAAAHLGLLFPLAFTARLAAEAASGLGGLGALCRRALGEGDLSPLMIASSSLAFGGLVCALVTDTAGARSLGRGETDPRPGARAAFVIGVGLAGAGTALALLRPLLGGALGRAAEALAYTLPFSALALGAALVTALVGGFVAGAMSRTASAALSRALELACSLPTPLLAAFAFGIGYRGALLLGVVRGIEAAYLLRARLNELRKRRDLSPHALGRAPLNVYLRLLPASVGPALACVALTGSWVVGLEAAATALGAGPSASIGARALGGDSAAWLAVAIVALVSAAWAEAAQRFGTSEGEELSRSAPLVLQLKRRIRSATPDHEPPNP